MVLDYSININYVDFIGFKIGNIFMLTNKNYEKITSGRPITWLICHPNPKENNLSWIVDERIQEWDFSENWQNHIKENIGRPQQPWPKEIIEWINEGHIPVVFRLNDFKYIDEKHSSWWNQIYKYDIIITWVLGWNHLNKENGKHLWRKLSLEQKVMILEKTVQLKEKLHFSPSKNRFKKCVENTINTARKQEHGSDLLIDVIQTYSSDWLKKMKK